MSDQNSIQIKMALDGVSQVSRDIKKVQDEILGFAGQIGKAAGFVASFAAASLGIEKIGEGFKKVIDLGSKLNDLGAQTSASVRGLAILRQTLADNGASADDAGFAVNMMQRALAEAAEGTGEAAKTFADLKLNIGDLWKLDPVDQFKAVAGAINQVDDASKRVALARGVFGKSGGGLLPLLTNPDAFKEAEASLGRMPELLQRNATTLDAIGDVLGRLPQKANQFFLGILDQVGPGLKNALNIADAIDLTAAGQKVGAFVSLTVDMIRDGKLPEFIGLLIEAGFELGTIGAKKAWDGMVGFLGSNMAAQIAMGLTNGVVTFGVRVGQLFNDILGTAYKLIMSFGVGTAQLLVESFTAPAIYLGAGLMKVMDEFREKIQVAGNFWKEVFASGINFLAAGFEVLLNRLVNELNTVKAMFGFTNNQTPQVKLGRVESTPSDVRAAMTMSQALAAQNKVVNDATSGVTGFLDKSLAESFAAVDETMKQRNAWLQQRLEESRKILGLGSLFAPQATALQSLIDMLNKYVDARNKAGDTDKKNAAGAIPPMNVMAQLREAERQAKEQLLALDRVRFLVEADYSKTTAEKWPERKQLLEQERDVLTQIISLLQQRANMPGIDPKEREQIMSRVDSFQGQLGGKDKEIAQLGADPNSTSQQFLGMFTKIREEWGTLATQLSTSFKGVFDGAISSISGGITSLFMRTKTLGQAVQEIAVSIGTSLVGAIVQMGVRWIATQLLMATMGKTIAAASMAATSPIALAQAAIWTAPATLASIATLGAAAAQAPASISGAMALVKAQGLLGGAFEAGGNPPVGKLSLVGERGPEFFVPRQAGTIIPADVTAQMMAGGVSGGQTNVQTNVSFHQWNRESEMLSFIRNNSDAKHIILGHVKSEIHNLTGRS